MEQLQKENEQLKREKEQWEKKIRNSDSVLKLIDTQCQFSSFTALFFDMILKKQPFNLTIFVTSQGIIQTSWVDKSCEELNIHAIEVPLTDQHKKMAGLLLYETLEYNKNQVKKIYAHKVRNLRLAQYLSKINNSKLLA